MCTLYKVCSLQRCYQCQWLRWLGNGISSKWLFLHPLEAMEQHRSRNYLLCDVIIVRTNWGKEACFLLPGLDIAANNHSFPCLRKIFEKILHDAVNFFLWWKVMEVWLEGILNQNQLRHMKVERRWECAIAYHRLASDLGLILLPLPPLPPLPDQVEDAADQGQDEDGDEDGDSEGHRQNACTSRVNLNSKYKGYG